MIRATNPTSCPRVTSKLPLCWHTEPNSGERALLPALTPDQVWHLFNLAEQNRRRHPEYTKTLIHYRGRRFTVDGTALGLRPWFGVGVPALRVGVVSQRQRAVTSLLHKNRPARKITIHPCGI